MPRLSIKVLSGGAGNTTSFRYTVVGNEADLANLVITLPSAQDASDYSVAVSQEQFTSLLGMGVLTASKTTTQFTLSLSANATAGDVFAFHVTPT